MCCAPAAREGLNCDWMGREMSNNWASGVNEVACDVKEGAGDVVEVWVTGLSHMTPLRADCVLRTCGERGGNCYERGVNFYFRGVRCHWMGRVM